MTKTLMILVASTALTAGLGLPAWSAMHAPAAGTAFAPLSAVLDAGEHAYRLILVDDDEGDDEDEGGSEHRKGSNDDDDDEEDGCDDDGGGCGAGAAAAAPAGSVAPPQNGLFGTGAPQAQVK